MAIAVTGNRDLPLERVPDVLRAIRQYVLPEDIVYVGGAIGADALATISTCVLRETNTPRIISVLPCTIKEVPISVRETIKMCSDEIVELGIPITSKDGYAAYHVRNRYMVDRASTVLAIHDGREHGGTWSTMHYARKQGKVLHVI